jgi:hypothetical protein
VAKSAAHSATSYDDTGYHFGPVKVNVNATTHQLWRAVIYMKWIRGGSTEGWVKARIEFYGVKWTVGVPSYIYQDACDGMAD